MSIGARPLDSRGVVSIIDRKMADFRSVARTINVCYLGTEKYFEEARRDPDVRFAIESGFMSDLEDEWRDPVLVSVTGRIVTTCPPLALRVLREEPPEIHRAFVEGAFLRKLFRFFVPAAHEGGAPWEAVEQVREIMQRHFALQLVVTETVLGHAA
jgi:hypothetical protein